MSSGKDVLSREESFPDVTPHAHAHIFYLPPLPNGFAFPCQSILLSARGCFFLARTQTKDKW